MAHREVAMQHADKPVSLKFVICVLIAIKLAVVGIPSIAYLLWTYLLSVVEWFPDARAAWVADSSAFDVWKWAAVFSVAIVVPIVYWLVQKDERFQTEYFGTWNVALPAVGWGLALVLILKMAAFLLDLSLRTPSSAGWDGFALRIGSVPLAIWAGCVSLPVGDELLFRGYVWGVLRRRNWGETKAIWTATILWVIFRHSGEFVGPYSNPIFLVHAIALGYVLGRIRAQSGNVWSSIVVSSFANLLSIVLSS